MKRSYKEAASVMIQGLCFVDILFVAPALIGIGAAQALINYKPTLSVAKTLTPDEMARAEKNKADLGLLLWFFLATSDAGDQTIPATPGS